MLWNETFCIDFHPLWEVHLSSQLVRILAMKMECLNVTANHFWWMLITEMELTNFFHITFEHTLNSLGQNWWIDISILISVMLLSVIWRRLESFLCLFVQFSSAKWFIKRLRKTRLTTTWTQFTLYIFVSWALNLGPARDLKITTAAASPMKSRTPLFQKERME